MNSLKPETRQLEDPSRRELFEQLVPPDLGFYEPVRALRRPGTGSHQPEADPDPPPFAIRVFSKAAYGPTAQDLADFAALGSTDSERLVNWVVQQLHPSSIPDPVVALKLSSGGFTTLNKSLTQLFADHHVADPPWQERIRPAYETSLATWIRAVHSRRQLFEVMVEFWHNHFNVYAWEFITGPVWVHYDRDVIRAHALGNFRQLLEAVVRAPAMLIYLNQYESFAQNGAGYGNENFARELLELYTLGAEVSYGSIPREQVPGWPNPQGYCEADVQDAARALTGWTFDIDWVSWRWGGGNTGQFLTVDWSQWNERIHSVEPKMVLGVSMPPNRTALQDGQHLLDILAQHPATGRFIAKKLCRRLIGDVPPQSLVDSAAALFTSLWQAPDQIAQVVQHILLSDAFQSTWGQKVKRPFEIVVSALRAGNGNFPFTMLPADEPHVNAFHWFYEAGGQPMFGWAPPNGFPDVRGAWMSSNPRVALWRTLHWFVEADGNNQDRFFNIVQKTLASPARSANEIVDFWIDQIYRRPLPLEDREFLVAFMAQGVNPDLDLPIHTNVWPSYLQDRLRTLVGLLFSAPEFYWR